MQEPPEVDASNTSPFSDSQTIFDKGVKKTAFNNPTTVLPQYFVTCSQAE